MNNKDRAWLVAEKGHSNQTYDIYPYTYHLHMVVKFLEDLGYDETVIIAGILHDILEDTDISYNDIKTAFGNTVAEIVYCVTDELGRNRKERKEKTYPKIYDNWRAVVVKIADRYANMSYSKQYTPTLFKMYKKEFADFKSHIDNPEHPKDELYRAWKKLETI